MFALCEYCFAQVSTVFAHNIILPILTMKDYTFRPMTVGPNYRLLVSTGIALLAVWISLLAALPALG